MSLTPPPVTIVLPTCNRPIYLEEALVSISKQSRKDLIYKIIVSENSGNKTSQSVVKKFSELPIHYKIQDPIISGPDHLVQLVEEVDTKWIAFLGDDDKWGKHHLEDAFGALLSNPQAIAFVTQDVLIDANSEILGAPAHFALLPPAKRDFLRTNGFVILDVLDVGVASLIRTPMNLWGLVVSSSHFKVALNSLTENGNAADTDRYLFWELAKAGNIIYGGELNLYYRRHPESMAIRLIRENAQFHDNLAHIHSNKIYTYCLEQSLPLLESWWQAITDLPSKFKGLYWENSIPGAKKLILSKLRHKLINSDLPLNDSREVAGGELLPDLPHKENMYFLRTLIVECLSNNKIKTKSDLEMLIVKNSQRGASFILWGYGRLGKEVQHIFEKLNVSNFVVIDQRNLLAESSVHFKYLSPIDYFENASKCKPVLLYTTTFWMETVDEVINRKLRSLEDIFVVSPSILK